MASGTLTLHGYDETNVTNGAGTWMSTTNPLSIKNGSVASLSANGNITFSGSPNESTQNVTLTSRAGIVDKAGFNLIGNPYPSYLDWDAILNNTADAGVNYQNRAALRLSTSMVSSEIDNAYSFWTVNGDGVSGPNGAAQKFHLCNLFG